MCFVCIVYVVCVGLYVFVCLRVWFWCEFDEILCIGVCGCVCNICL